MCSDFHHLLRLHKFDEDRRCFSTFIHTAKAIQLTRILNSFSSEMPLALYCLARDLTLMSAEDVEGFVRHPEVGPEETKDRKIDPKWF